MSGVIVDIAVFKELIKLRVPEINKRLDELGKYK